MSKFNPTVLALRAASEICHEMGISHFAHRVRIAELIDEHTKLPDMSSALRKVTVGKSTLNAGLDEARTILNNLDA